MEENQNTTAEEKRYRCAPLSSGSNYFALLRTRLPARKPGRRGGCPPRLPQIRICAP
jgi:hypothetical protein